jgi:RHS repeat-associated protein
MMLDLNDLSGEPEQLERNDSRKFTAREDDGTGLYYYRARYYKPALGRFLSEDPLDVWGGDVNLYAYVRDNPPNRFDKLGLQMGFEMAWGLTPHSSGELEAWQRIGDKIRVPDYYSGTINVVIPNPYTVGLVSWSGQITIDRCGVVYLAPIGLSGGYSTPISGSMTAGWLNRCEVPNELIMQQFLVQNSFGISGGYWLGGGETYVPGSGWATELGFYTPQFGGSWHYSKLIGGFISPSSYGSGWDPLTVNVWYNVTSP